MTDATKQGGYAYPREIPDIVCSPEEATQIIHEHSGMTLRDAAALAALPAVVTQCLGAGLSERLMAGAAWQIADAFIAAREGKTDE